MMNDKKLPPKKPPSEPDIKQLAEEAKEFILPFRSVVLSTTDEEGLAHASYAPFIRANHCLYIFVSALAKHSQTLSSGKATAFLIQDESLAKNIFARKRITLHCDVSAIDNHSKAGSDRLNELEGQHGKTVNVLRSLPDFQLYQLQPTSANYVTGFGAAFDLSQHLDALI